MLYMHERGSVIGYVKDIQVDGGDVTCEPVFDEASELSSRCKKQYEFGSLKMASISIEIVEMSSDKSDLLDGQTSPTITKSRLLEVSLVDIGANDDAIVMTRNGKKIEFGKGGASCLPLLTDITNQKKKKEMDQKTIALKLGLPETATDDQITAALQELQSQSGTVETLKKEKAALELATLTQAVESAISEKRIDADRKDQFIKLGRSIGVEELKKTFEAMTPKVKLSAMVGHHGGVPIEGNEPGRYKKLSEVPEDEIAELKANNPETYRKLYKAEYGMEMDD